LEILLAETNAAESFAQSFNLGPAGRGGIRRLTQDGLRFNPRGTKGIELKQPDQITTLMSHPLAASSQTIIVPYLVTVIIFMVHVYEEFAAHIERYLTRLSGLQVTQTDFLVIAAFSGPVVWLVGAVMLLKRWAFGYFFASTFLFGMMFAELSHFVSPFMENGAFHYSPGVYTAILPVILGWFTFRIILREMKQNQGEAF
jgi:hypothetical protein